MKPSLSLLFCFLTLVGSAQNWKTVTSGDTTYFRGGLHKSNYDMTSSYYSDILKMIFVDSSSVQNADSIFRFYTTLRVEGPGQCIDTTAPGWLGHRFIKKADGNEVYFNSFGDTIYVQAQAAPGDIWLLARDTSGIEFRATLSLAGTMIIEGTTDSFKSATILAFQNGLPVAHPYNSKILKWSKDHGWVSCLDFFRFPNNINGWEEFGAVTDSVQLARLDNGFSQLDIDHIDLLWKYAPGNEWISHKEQGSQTFNLPYNGAIENIVHDSIISSTLLNTNSIQVTFQRKQYSIGGWQYIQGTNPHWEHTSSSALSILTDTISNTATTRLNTVIKPELIFPDVHSMSYTDLSTRYFPDTLCSRYTVETLTEQSYPLDFSNGCYIIGSSVSGGGIYNKKWLQGFGALSSYNISSGFALTPGTLDYYLKTYHSYLKLGSCTHGTKIDVMTLTVPHNEQQRVEISIYPNPAKDYILVKCNKEDEQGVIRLMDISGRTLLESKGLQHEKNITTTGVSPGLYIITVAGRNGSSVQKVQIQR